MPLECSILWRLWGYVCSFKGLSTTVGITCRNARDSSKWHCPNFKLTSVSFPISLEYSPPSLLPLLGTSSLPNTVAISEYRLEMIQPQATAHCMLFSGPISSQPLRFGKFVEPIRNWGSILGARMDGIHVEKAVSGRALLIVSPAPPSLISPFTTLGLL